MEKKVARKLSNHTLLVVGVYTAISILWILFSDQFVNSFFEGSQLIRAQSYKGIFFVITTAVFLFLLIGNKNRSIKNLFEQIEERMQIFEGTFEQAAVGIAHFSAKNEWLLVNKKMGNMLGYSTKELKTLPFSKLVHAEDLKKGKVKDQKLINGDIDDYVMEKRYHTKDDGILYGRITKSRVEDSSGKLQYIVAIVEDIGKEKKAHKKLKESLHQKNLLIREIHHRVKNNLAIISGLLELQAYNTEDQNTQKFLRDSMMRIKTMALIHESFYQSKRISFVVFNKYLSDFAEHIKTALSFPDNNISLKIKHDTVKLNINQAIPLGLLLNELVINAYLHAFQSQPEGHINVSLSKNGKEITLIVSDNGIGLPDSFNLQNTTSLGATIIKTLVMQLNADIDFNGNKGTNFQITFDQEEKQGSSSMLSSENIF